MRLVACWRLLDAGRARLQGNRTAWGRGGPGEVILSGRCPGPVAPLVSRWLFRAGSAEEQCYRGELARRGGADAGVEDLVVTEH
jgi:hypothetical protein